MIGDALRLEIEKYAIGMKRTNPLYTKAADGTLSRESISAYLANIHYLVQHTPVHLVQARERALAMGDERLALHFEQKLEEENGHDAWAERDIGRVTRNSEIVPKRKPLESMRRYVDHIAAVIEEDPRLYLAYILFAEYLIVVAGPDWLELLEQRCGIAKTSMTVIGNHIELDKGHVEHALDEIDDLVGDPTKLPRMREVLRETIALFDLYCSEVSALRAGGLHVVRDVVATVA